MEQELNSDMNEKENLTLIQIYYDQAKTKPKEQYQVDQFGQMQGEFKYWHSNEQIRAIGNYKDGNWCGKYQYWWPDGRRDFIDTNHHKKRLYGTKIKFKYK